MAFVQTPDDQNQQPGMNSPQQTPQTASGAGGNSSVGVAAPSQGAAAVPNTTQAPPVQDLKAYLAANAPQAVQMGQNIAGNLNQTYNQATGDVNAAQQAFDSNLQGQTVNPDQNLVSAAASNPAEFVKDPNNVAAFKAQENAAYNGPQTFESTPGYVSANSSVNSALQKAPDINKPGGIQQLVTGIEQNPTLGMENLDSLLLQENPEAVAPIQGALGQFQNLAPQLANAATNGNANIQSAITADNAAKAGVQNTFLTGPNAVVPAWESSLQQALAQAAGNYANAGKTQNEITGDINSNSINKLTPSEVAQFGLTPDEISHYLNLENQNNSLYGGNGILPENSFYTPGSLPSNYPILANTATAEDYAKNAALEELLGTGYTSYLTDSNSGLAGQAGTPINPKFDISKALENVGDIFRENDRNFIKNSAEQNAPINIQDFLNGNFQGNVNYSPETIAALNRFANDSYK